MKTECKKFVRRSGLPLLLATILLPGCDLLGDGILPGRSRAETVRPRREKQETAPDTTADVPTEAAERLWISGVAYPEGYDWQRDTAYGIVDARLILLRDGTKVLDIPAGDRQEISTDPDMHRIVGGHLYTDYSSGTETVVRRDGEELFRYDGREMLVGFLVRDDIVWTLGVSRTSGRGPVLRRNGVQVFSDPLGRLPPGFGNRDFEGGMLHMDKGEMFFFYRSSDGWIQVRGRLAEPIFLPPAMAEVYDIRRIGGRTVTAGRTAAQPLVIAQDDDARPCSTQGAPVRNVSIVPSGDGGFFLRGETVRGTSVTSVLWHPDGTERISAPGSVLGFYGEEGHTACLFANPDGTVSRYVKDGASVLVDGRNHFISNRCALLRNGEFYLLLTPADFAGGPFLLRDGVREDIPLNGYLTGMVLTR